MRVRLSMVYDHGSSECGALREAHHGIEGSLLRDDALCVLKCLAQSCAGICVTRIVAVERAIDDALEFYVSLMPACYPDEH